MTIESATYVTQLNASNPANSDIKSEGDDHIRLIKSCLLASFPVDFRGLASSISGLRYGQAIKYDGTGLNVNVRSRYSAYQTTGDLAVPNTTYSTIPIVTTAIENTLGFVWGSGSKLTIADYNKYLAFRVVGVMAIANPKIGDYVRVRVMKNSGTVVSGPYSYYMGQEFTGTAYSNIDIYQVIPSSGLTAADTLYFEVGYVASGTVPATKNLLSGARVDLYDMG